MVRLNPDEPVGPNVELESDATTPIDLGRLGRYMLLERIGRGAQGAVFKAVQPGTQRVIAIKRLADGVLAGGSARARFEREIETASALSHPGIVTVFGTDSVDGQPVLLMEWIDGQPIDRWAFDTDPPRPVGERLALFALVCDAVAHAHQHAVLHRDLKPSNILVDRQGRPRVLDFGLAKVLGDTRAVSAASAAGAGFLGTPAFAAPEQFQGGRAGVDTRTDIYALGVVLYLLLTGRLPFDAADDLPALLDAIRHQSPRHPSLIARALDSELDAIALTALAKEPERRYQSADAFAADIRRYLQGQIVLAHPPSTLYHLRKLVARHRLAFSIAASALLAVSSLAVVSCILAARLAARGSDLAAALVQAQDASQQADQQARLARQAQQQAQADAARSAANAEFLQSMLDSLGQAVSAGDAQPARAMILDAKARLESGELADQPELQVACWRRLASTSFQLGLFVETEQATDQATRLCAACLGPAHPEMGHCLLLSGLLAETRGDLAHAESLYRQSAQVFTVAFGHDSADTAHAVNNLGCILKDEGRYDDALQCHLDALAVRTRLFGPVHRDTAMSLCNLGTLMRVQKKTGQAEDHYKQALDAALRSCAPTDQMVLAIRGNLARLAREQGRLDEAEQWLREELAIVERVHGQDSLRPARTLDDLAIVLDHQQRFDEAVDASARALALHQRHLPPDHPQVAGAHLNYAWTLISAGRLDDAEPVLRRAAELAAGSNPPATRIEASAKRSLIDCLRKMERNDEADQIKAQLAKPSPSAGNTPGPP